MITPTRQNSRLCFGSLGALLLSVVLGWTTPADPLLYFPFDEGQGNLAADASGHHLDGVVSAAWTNSPSGKALAFDGQPSGLVKVQLPPEQRFGRGSWSFSAWINPRQFTIDDPQNQRRLFSFGPYPDATLVIDLLANGQLGFYFCYRPDPTGPTIAVGGSSTDRLNTGQWAHVAVVCDRAAGRVETYLNGFGQGGTQLPPNFAGDFSVGGELTLGCGWHNYWGLMDEVKIYRRALSGAEVKAEYARLKDVFGVVESPEMVAAKRREALLEVFAETHNAWAAGDYAAVRAACAIVSAAPEAPANLRSYAELRGAQSYAAEGRADLAKVAYARIATNLAYPLVHRDEAKDCEAELERVARGRPARDPAASRTQVPPVALAAQIFVSPRGDDTNSGSATAPVATLVHARDLVRALKAAGTNGAIAVTVAPGIYPVTGPLALTQRDSGTPDSPVIYQAIPPGKAILYGGRRLTGFQPVTEPAILARLPAEARGRVLRCDLAAQGISDYGKLAVRGFGQPPSPPTLELFVNGAPMTLARWPNQGLVGIRRLVEPGSSAEGKPSVIEYLDDRAARWTSAEDAWLFGYFRYLWADATIPIARVDPVAHTISAAPAYQYGPAGMDAAQGIQYYAFNLLEELDQPGEWYLDRKAGVLYLYPPSDLAGATVEIGMLSTPMVTLDKVTDVRLEGLTFDLGRYNGLELTDCSRCLIAGCTVSRLAGNGVTIQRGEADGILSCDIHTIGRQATELMGGDRASLRPGRHFIENCRIHDFGRIDRTYTPAILLEGVGNRAAHNLMYNAPSSAMRIEGNDHLIEFNEVRDVVRESDDQGAMELFGNPTFRGVVFRYNRFRNCGNTDTRRSFCGQAAIRFDDAISGMQVYGNIFERSANVGFGAVQMNSGRDNILDNNLFVNCKQGVSGGYNRGNAIWNQVAAKPPPADFYLNELYLQRYPELATLLVEPGINHVWRNVFYRCGPMTTGSPAALDLLENGNFGETDPGFVNAAHGDYRLKSKAALFAQVGFRPIPIDEIGLYADAYRAGLPARAQ